MNLFSKNNSDSPVLWIRVDPDMQLIRSVEILQPDFQWQYQLRHERDVTAQTEAVRALERFPTTQTRKALTDIIENETCYYKVRLDSQNLNFRGIYFIVYIFAIFWSPFVCSAIIIANYISNLFSCVVSTKSGSFWKVWECMKLNLIIFKTNILVLTYFIPDAWLPIA